MIHKQMRGVRRGNSTGMQTSPAFGISRFRRTSFTEVEPAAPAVIELPRELEAEIPPLEDTDDPIIAEIAGGEVEIMVDGESPEAVIPNQESEVRDSEVVESSDIWNPVTGGVDCEPRIVIYDPGDGILRAIPDPLGVLCG